MMNIKEAADRLLLRELVDRVAILADRKDFKAQVQLFTEQAVSETISGGKSILKLTGREQMAEAFAGLVKDYETVYHFNGQQVVNIDGDRATGTCYCVVTLIGNENGKKTRTTIGVVYQDQYVRQNDHWLIAARTGNFTWQGSVHHHS